MRSVLCLTIAICLTIATAIHLSASRHAHAQRELVQVNQDFSTDPGWEGVNNRIVAEGPPTKTQDFGWSHTTHSISTPGEIGGTVWCSRTPAWYAMPLAHPLSYKDAFSASGRIAIRGITGTAYIGFFNSTRQEWRPWSAIAMRLSHAKRGETLHGSAAPGAQIWLDYMTATWKAGFMVLDSFIPGDGSVHTWSFSYDPDARVDTHWPDSRMQELFEARGKMSEEELLQALQGSEPNLTREEMRQRLELAPQDQGLLEYDPRRGVNYWEAKRDLDNVQGRVTFRLDDGPPVRYFLDPGIHDEPAAMDRFGFFNYQIPEGRTIEFYVSDLTVNGHKIDLSRDPNWQEMNNHITFVDRDFHPGQNFGFSQTNWAGTAPGEIGGLFWRNEPIDPYHGFYGEEVGELTLDDPISFSGTINFVNGGTDASMQFGYFNREDQFMELGEKKKRKAQVMGIRIADATSIGYSFQPFLNAKKGGAEKRGPQYVPDRRPRPFSFEYDPKANNGIGQVTAQLEETRIQINLKPEVRKAGARFDRFGLMNVRTGGKYVEVYLDDLTYTARRAPGVKASFFPEKVLKIPYPPRGRMY